MKTYYIVTEIGSEYNDEIYTLGGYGTPSKVYTNKQLAQDECDLFNIEKLSSEILNEYTYNLNKDIDIVKINDILNLNLSRDENDFTLPKFTLKQYRKVKEYINIEFYRVDECQGE